MKKILIPTDFSEATVPALNMAAHISKITGSPIKILHTYEMASLYSFSDISGTQVADLEKRKKINSKTRSEARQKLIDLISKAKLNDWKWFGHIIIKEGDPKTTILKKISKLNIGLTIFGTRRKKVNKGALLRNITCEIVSKSKAPVLTVPENYKNYFIKDVVYATNLKHKEQESFNKLADFAAIYNARIKLLHVCDRKKSNSDKLVLRLKQQADNIPYPKDKVSTELVYASNSIEGLLRFAHVNNPDVIAMTTHTKSFLHQVFHNSFTRLLVLYSEYPILTFNELNTGPSTKHKTSKHAKMVDFLLE